MPHFARLAFFASCTLACVSHESTIYGQELQPASTPSASSPQKPVEALQALTNPTANKVVEAGRKVAESADDARKKHEAWAAHVKDAVATADTIKIFREATNAAMAALTAATKAATKEASSAPGAVQGESAKRTAVAGLGPVARAAIELETHVADYTKAASAISARQTADDAVTKASKLATSALEAADVVVAELANLVREMVTPSLPTTGPRDENVFEALRVRLSGGAILFNGAPRIVNNADGTRGVQSNQFSQAASYLALEMQPRLLAFRDSASRGYARWYVEPTVAIRLTTVPVSGALTASNSRIESPNVAFLQSQKAAQFQVGMVAGHNFGGFDVKDSAFHWSIGASARYGLASITDSQRLVRPWDFDNDLFKQPTVGVRVTLYERDQRVGDSTRQGWAPTAYLDISAGKFENFERATGRDEAATACLQDALTCVTQAQGRPPEEAFDVWEPNRFAIEGRIYLQFLYLGIDLNSGPETDDMRFIGGITFKLDQFFARR